MVKWKKNPVFPPKPSFPPKVTKFVPLRVGLQTTARVKRIRSVDFATAQRLPAVAVCVLQTCGTAPAQTGCPRPPAMRPSGHATREHLHDMPTDD